jgi:hypothetical protein
MGIPKPEPDGWLGYDFVIANTDLSPKVLNGFHALSADENRANFFPTYWTPRNNITQVIFPGSHSDVGGGCPDGVTALSDRALEWMLLNLAGQGLRFDLHNIRALAPNPMGDSHDDGGNWPWSVLPKAPREFPTTVFGGSPAFTADRSIGERWGKPVNVLPANLRSDYEVLDDNAKTNCSRVSRSANVRTHVGTHRKSSRRYIEHLETVDRETCLVSLSDKVHNARSILRDLRKPEIGSAAYGIDSGNDRNWQMPFRICCPVNLPKN